MSYLATTSHSTGRLYRNSGRLAIGMPVGIKSEQWSASRRNRGRHGPEYPTGWLRSVLPDLSPGVAFHSFRHTFASILKNTEEPERLIEELMGHKHTSITLGRYGKPYDISIRARAINSIDYGLIVQPLNTTELVEVGNDVVEPINIMVCGTHKIYVSYDNFTLPIQLLQFLRPDLHGYSPFHDVIPDFMPD